VLKQFLDKFLYPAKQWARKKISREQFNQLRSIYRGVVFSGRKNPSLNASDTAHLKGRYVTEVAKLGQYLGRDLINEWGYSHSEISNRE
jgi:hypothetical protein